MLVVSLGQHSERGRKAVNQDSHGACLPDEPLRRTKGIAVALADGISSSDVAHEASAAAVQGFLADYYCTADAWGVKTSAQRVLAAVNAWLHAQTRRGPHRFERDRGHVCTLSVLVLRSTTAHLFHVGDARVYRVQGGTLEQLTEDHRVRVSGEQSYLGRALGVAPQVEIDHRALPLERGDTFVLATDGVYEHVDAPFVAQAVQHPDGLDAAARAIVAEALRRGSPDNLTVQIARVDALPAPEPAELPQQRAQLALPPPLAPRSRCDGYTIVRELHGSSRSHIHLAIDDATGQAVALKTPSTDLQHDAAYLDRFLLEEWVARRIDSPHVLKPCPPTRERRHLCVAMEYVEGQTLAQWLLDHPRPDLATVRGIVEQVARGLQAFHRLEMVHRDLRPENIMIDRTGTVKIIDFGAVRVAGLDDAGAPPGQVLGTLQYTAPEVLAGAAATPQSDLFSLGVIAYQMLAGRLPYGTAAARVRTVAAQKALVYRSVLDERRAIPPWVDEVLRRAVHPLPQRRPAAPSEFVAELQRPGADFLNRTRPRLAARHPVRFWQGLCAVLGLAVVVLLGVVRTLTGPAPAAPERRQGVLPAARHAAPGLSQDPPIPTMRSETTWTNPTPP